MAKGEITESLYKSDEVMHLINKKFITLTREEAGQNTRFLEKLMWDALIPRIANHDKIFKKRFKALVGRGSYFKRTKVGIADEYDICLLLDLGMNEDNIQFEANREYPGFVKLRLIDKNKLPDDLSFLKFRDTNGSYYIDQIEFRNWLQDVISRAIEDVNADYKETYTITKKKPTGPAYTLSIIGPHKENIDIDLVPCLGFLTTPPKKAVKLPEDEKEILSQRRHSNNSNSKSFTPRRKQSNQNNYGRNRKNQNNEYWVRHGYLINQEAKNNNNNNEYWVWHWPKKNLKRCKKERKWHVIAKPLTDSTEENILWRTSFDEHEKQILKGQMKNVVRQLKKFRDSQKFDKLYSYIIETIALHAIRNNNGSTKFQKVSNTFLFMKSLKQLETALRKRELPYFWSVKLNLLSSIKFSKVVEIGNKISEIISEIEDKIQNDPYIIAKFILTPEEFAEIN